MENITILYAAVCLLNKKFVLEITHLPASDHLDPHVSLFMFFSRSELTIYCIDSLKFVRMKNKE